MTTNPIPVDNSHAPSILLVDDDVTLRERLARALRERGFDVRTAGSADEAMEQTRADSPEMAVIDLRMPGRNGLELLRDMREHDPATRVLVLTGYGSIATAVEATKLGAEGVPPEARRRRRAAGGLRPLGSQPQGRSLRDPLARARRMGAHPAGARGLRREHQRSRTPAGHPPSLAAAEAPEVSACALSRGPSSPTGWGDRGASPLMDRDAPGDGA